MDIKTQAKALKLEMQKTNPNYKLADAYEALARLAGYKDWNTYSAKLKQQREATRKHRSK